MAELEHGRRFGPGRPQQHKYRGPKAVRVPACGRETKNDERTIPHTYLYPFRRYSLWLRRIVLDLYAFSHARPLAEVTNVRV